MGGAAFATKLNNKEDTVLPVQFIQKIRKPLPSKNWTTMWLVLIVWLVGQTGISYAEQPGNILTIQNDSGQFALVKTVGPTRAVTKIPLDQKKSVRLAPGEYYILVRFGFAPKEYIYTRGEPFTVKQEENKFTLTTITLHRVVAGMENNHEVSGDEFENFTLTKEGMP
ncbi:hypothetical protein [Candidatus Nitronereus thalassa]|uniref:PEGA domain-containing protein n=1 Tax=Candidatus Nitronereus thalassa TaxID=3020898 RepID=A0ABU3KC54_9BACT|nr:hypothetical protein [Candidatus Nitronereus thalassa]MDT7044095.1 hypothetical protein [Candidatus Nitronereus thalassa]